MKEKHAGQAQQQQQQQQRQKAAATCSSCCSQLPDSLPLLLLLQAALCTRSPVSDKVCRHAQRMVVQFEVFYQRQCSVLCSSRREGGRLAPEQCAVYCAGKAGPRAGSTDSGSSLTGGCLHQLSTRSPAAFSFSTSFPLKFPRLPATGHTLFSSH